MAAKKSKIALIVTTEYKGIFFGYVDCEEDELDQFIEDAINKNIIKLTNCRNCINWGSSIKGFGGLGKTGPDSGCRIGEQMPWFTIKGITGVMGVTSEAIEAWEKAPW